MRNKVQEKMIQHMKMERGQNVKTTTALGNVRLRKNETGGESSCNKECKKFEYNGLQWNMERIGFVEMSVPALK